MTKIFRRSLIIASSLFIALITVPYFSSQRAGADIIVGNLICPEPGFDLEPSTDDNFIGQDHTVTATLTEDGKQISGRYVLFEVAGVNPTSGSDTTDANGQATFTYTGVNPGLDTITATTTIPCRDLQSGEPHDIVISDTATKNWTIFVVPESPIGLIALVGSSIAALGGFLFWKRKQGNSQPHSLGDLGI